jgi:hypothetical protein
MSTSAPVGKKTSTHRPEPNPVGRPDRASRSVSWSWGLIALTLPAGIVAVLLIEAIAAVSDLGTGEVLGAPDWVDYGFYAAVAAPLVAAIVVGLRGWRREHASLALRAALLAAFLLVVGTTLVVVSV